MGYLKRNKENNKLLNSILLENEELKKQVLESSNKIDSLMRELSEFERKIYDQNAVFTEKLEAIHFWPNQNLRRRMFAIANYDSAKFVLEEMGKTKAFVNKFDLLTYAISNITIEGDVMEFGVFKGETINHIARSLPEKKIFGFDSFIGLPENWRTGFEKGHFAVDNLPSVEQNVELIKGFFDDTLPEFVLNNNSTVSFLHIDSDLYSSAKTIFECLNKKIVDGTIIVFDEFINYPGWEEGEYKAFMEFVEDNEIIFEYIGYVETSEQVAVRIKKR